MKTGKKFWSLLLALVLVLGMAAPAAYAETTDEAGEITIESIAAAPVTFLEGAYNDYFVDDEGNEVGVYYPLYHCHLQRWQLF